MRFLLLLIALAVPASAAEYFVSPAGDDAASGLSIEAAWKTVDRVHKAHLKPGDVVRFGPGDHAGPLVIRHTGTKEQPIIFAAAHAAGPVVIKGEACAVEVSASHVFLDGFILATTKPSNRGVVVVHADNDLENISITRNIIRTSRAHGVWVDAKPGVSVRGLNIVCNTFHSLDAAAICVRNASGGTIYGNGIGTGPQPAGAEAAIRLETPNVQKITVEKNRINAATRAGACGIQLLDTGPGIVLLDNDIYAATDVGIALKDARGVDVIGNIIRNTPTGVRITGGTHDHAISQNTIVATLDGIRIEGKPPAEKPDAPQADARQGYVIQRNLILVGGRAALHVTGGCEASVRTIEGNCFDPPRFRWADDEHDSVAALEKVIGDTKSVRGRIRNVAGLPTVPDAPCGARRETIPPEPQTFPR